MDYDCSHICDVVQNLDVNEMRVTLKNRSCNVCLRIDQLWICMVCRQILCGRYASGHCIAHFEYHKNHCITLNIESATLYCYKCDKEVEPKNHDDELNRLRQFILFTQGTNQSKKRRQTANQQIAKKKKTVNRRGPRTNKKAGLTNEGNSCFMNAVWQSLSNISPFVYCMKHLPAIINNNYTSLKEIKNGVIAEELCKVLINLSEWKPPGYKMGDPVSSCALYHIICKTVPRYRGFHQHDAHEFLIYTLDKLHSELKQLDIEQEIKMFDRSTIVSFVFGGMLLSEVCCLVCRLYSKTYDPFLDISLDIPDYTESDKQLAMRPMDTLTDCLSRFIEIEELAENNFYYCNGCESKQKSTKKFWISQLPNVLCLHLKRFRWVKAQRIKIHTPIQFPIESLDMSQFLLSDKRVTIDKEDCLYDLSAVIVHEGNGGGSGHYTSFAIDKGEWFEFNDEKVHEVNSSIVQNVEAYILFYIKRKTRLRTQSLLGGRHIINNEL